jgi:hypothetical protein
MTDWKKMASALDPAIPEADAEKVLPVLNALEAAFRPLRASIPDGTDLWTGPDSDSGDAQ